VEKREAIVCEGQIDVIRCHQAGFKTAVAAQGTAFTDDHARVLRRYADGVVLVFDSDDAGRNAALRTTTVFLQAGLAVRIASLPQSEDPDSLILKQGPEAFQRALQQAVPAIDFQINLLLAREDSRTEAGLMRTCRAVLETISKSPNAIQRDALMQTAARRLNVSVAALQSELRPLLRQAPAREAEPGTAPKPQRPAQEVLLAEHLGSNPALVALAERYLPLNLITDPLCHRFIEAMVVSHHERADLLSVLTERDDENRSLSSFAAELLSAPQKTGSEASHQQAVEGLILVIWRAELQRRRQALESRMAETAQEDARLALTVQAQQLTTDLNRLKRWDTGEPILQVYAATTG
jgi:DNA primase